MTTVTIQYQETRKPYRWVSAFRAKVLYHDEKVILVRGAGTHSLFSGKGGMRAAGYNLNHPAAKNIPDRYRGWRVHPKSVARLQG